MSDKILVVDDEPQVRALLRAALGKAYDLAEAETGEEALRMARGGDFRLVLLDVMMPGMTGYEVCHRLRKNPLTCHMTIVMLTAREREEDVVAGLQAGADDYILKPFKISELRARIESHLRRQWRELQASPLTGLPGNMQIEQVLKASLKGDVPFSVCYADLNSFKAYNDHYGFSAGDTILRFAAGMLTDAVQEAGQPEVDFVGHVGGDDFVVVTEPERAQRIAESIVGRFDEAVKQFYAPEDLGRGGIEAKDRQGNLVFAPLLSISLAVVTVVPGEYEHPAQIAQTAADIKHYLKASGAQGSRYLVDRRGEGRTSPAASDSHSAVGDA